MTEKTIGFGILGCGMIAQIHRKAIEMLPNTKLIGVADYNLKRAEMFAADCGGVAYENYEAMLADPAIDVVCICTPSGCHCEDALTALNAGKHVVLEKPMAIRTVDADRIIKTCQETGKHLTVICQLRFSKDIQRLKALLESHSFGTISLCSLYMKYWRSPEYYSASSWKGTLKMDGGGALINQGIHGVDMLLYLMGDVKLEHAQVQTSFHSIEVEDTAIAAVAYENGAIGVIEASTCAYPGFERKLEIIGSSGCAVLREDKLEKLVIDGETLIDGIQQNGAINSAADPAALHAELHAAQIGNLISTIYGEEDLRIDAKEGKRAVTLIEQIYTRGRKEK